MKIINKLHPKIRTVANINKDRESVFIRISGREIYFSKAACNYCSLQEGKSIEFIEDDGQWHFFMSDAITGFRLTAKDKVFAGLRIINKSLIELFRNDLKQLHKKFERTSFSIEHSDLEYGGEKVFKIII